MQQAKHLGQEELGDSYIPKCGTALCAEIRCCAVVFLDTFPLNIQMFDQVFHVDRSVGDVMNMHALVSSVPLVGSVTLYWELLTSWWQVTVWPAVAWSSSEGLCWLLLGRGSGFALTYLGLHQWKASGGSASIACQFCL